MEATGKPRSRNFISRIIGDMATVPAEPQWILGIARSAMLARLDDIDWKILSEMQADGRITNVELASRVGISAPPCLRRVRALEEAGVITGYHAAIDPVALGRGFRVLVHIDLAAQDTATIEAFERKIAEIDAVEYCARMFGQPDYHLWVAVADLEAYEQLYMSALTRLPGVARTNSQFPMKTVLPR